MSIVTHSLPIPAPPDTVWDLLADLSAATRYGGARQVDILSTTREGVGPSRRCDFGGGKGVVEEVRRWVPGRAITFEVVEAHAPLEGGTVAFDLEPATGGTLLRGKMTIRLRYGALGRLMAATVGKAMARRQLRSLLEGVRREVTGSGV